MNIIIYIVTLVSLCIYIYVDTYLNVCRKLKKYYDNRQMSVNDVLDVVSLPEEKVKSILGYKENSQKNKKKNN